MNVSSGSVALGAAAFIAMLASRTPGRIGYFVDAVMVAILVVLGIFNISIAVRKMVQR